ncbi:MAG: AAA family ATPase [Chitinophagaceae bacterium]|nr:AAA family ATPase [Chitinophagaceae bacterium]
MVTNYTTERSILIKAIWKFLIEEYKSEITTFNTERNGLERGIAALQVQINARLAEYKALDAEIKNLSKNVTSIQPAINEINRLFKILRIFKF